MKRRSVALSLAIVTLATTWGCKRSHNHGVPTPREHMNPSRDATARKERSEALLKARGIRVNPYLPVIDDESEAKLRTKDAAVDRALALVVVAGKAEGAPQDAVDGMIQRLGAAEFFSPNERKFIHEPNPSAEQKHQLIWRYEALAVLEWAVGAAPDLPEPTKVADVQALVRRVLQPDPADFRTHAKLRSATEILDQTDLAYRYDWACVDARVRHHPSPAVPICDVIQERHYVLNWLISYENLPWDDVRTDT